MTRILRLTLPVAILSVLAARPVARQTTGETRAVAATDNDACHPLTVDDNTRAALRNCARIETPLGQIELVIDTAHAPATSANFLKYVDAGLYDGGRFYRVTRPDNYTPALPNRPMMQIIQGGLDPAQRAKAFPPIPLERTSVTGLKHVAGTVSMARGEPDSATSEFFILLDDQPSLDFGGLRFADGQGGAAFGRVSRGLDVVRKIQQQRTQGQNLAPSVQILSIARAAK